MFKLIKVLNKPLFKKNIISIGNTTASRCIYDINFDSEEEVLKNVLNEIMLIGFNLPESKNVLTETALEKIYNYIEDFDNNDKITAAVLHGSGGNFCTGTVLSDEALMLSQKVLKKLNELKKPIIGSLSGYTTHFGVYLAIMCDVRIIDVGAMVGFTDKSEDLVYPPFIYERLLLTVGLSRALDLICTKRLWNATECSQYNFACKCVEFGSALGQSIVVAQNLAFHRPLSSIIRDRANIFSFLKTKDQ